MRQVFLARESSNIELIVMGNATSNSCITKSQRQSGTGRKVPEDI